MAYRLLFPLATSYALIAVPLWLVLRSRHPAVIGATWHGHEMLFGFALAVIAWTSAFLILLVRLWRTLWPARDGEIIDEDG